jgi:hypothetical protein
MIGRLYATERALPPLLPPSDDPAQREQRRQREEQRRQLRQRDADSVWDELAKWLGEQKPGALPKSPLGTAIGYASNNWAALKRYLEQGFLALDNNLSERTLRAVALGRNAWGVIGSQVGGTTAAVLYSIVGTVQAPGDRPVRVPAGRPAGVVRAGREADSRAVAGLAAGSLAVEPDAGQAHPRRDRRVNLRRATRRAG